uniref:Uncharacterized protein n=1 Tax=Peronospora matthiolae TaxID=2874970 RepID=A0AAV1T2R6_9STRA
MLLLATYTTTFTVVMIVAELKNEKARPVTCPQLANSKSDSNQCYLALDDGEVDE